MRSAVGAIAGSELEALRLAVHRPAEVADRLEAALFAHPLCRSAFAALASASTLHEAVGRADPQTADLLTMLAVEDSEEDPDDVMVRLAERAGRRALEELQAASRQAPDPSSYVPTVGWLKLTLEALRTEDPADKESAREAERSLVAWLVARSEPDPSGDASGGRPGASVPGGDAYQAGGVGQTDGVGQTGGVGPTGGVG